MDLPAVLFICPRIREPATALIVETGEELEREPGEELEAFERRPNWRAGKGETCNDRSKRPSVFLAEVNFSRLD